MDEQFSEYYGNGVLHFFLAFSNEPYTQQRRSDLCNSRKETARPRSKFRRSGICERLIYFHDRSIYFAGANQVQRCWDYINRSQIHKFGNWERGIAASFLGTHKSFSLQYRWKIVQGGVYKQLWTGIPTYNISMTNEGVSNKQMMKCDK